MAENKKTEKSILLYDFSKSQTVTCTRFFESFYNGNTYYVIEYEGNYAFLDIIDGRWVRIPNKDFDLFEKIIFSEKQKELDISQLPDVLKYIDVDKKKEPEKVIPNTIFIPSQKKENNVNPQNQTANESPEEVLIKNLKNSILNLQSLIYIGSPMNQTPLSALGQKLKELSTKLTKEQFEAVIYKFQAKVTVLENTIGKGKVPLKTVSELLTTLNTFCSRLIMCLNDMDKKRLEEILNQIVLDKSENLPELPEKIYTKTTVKTENPKEFILNVYVDTSDKAHYKYYITSKEASFLGINSQKNDEDLFEISIKQLLEFEEKFDVQKYDYKSYVKQIIPPKPKTIEPEPVITKDPNLYERLTRLGNEAPKPITKAGESIKKSSGENVNTAPIVKPENEIEVIPNQIVIPPQKAENVENVTKEKIEVFVTTESALYVKPEDAKKYGLTYVMPYLNVYGISEKEFSEKLANNQNITIEKIVVNFPPVDLIIEYVVWENEIIYYLDSVAANDIGLNNVDLTIPHKRLTSEEIDLIKNHFRVKVIKRDLTIFDNPNPAPSDDSEEIKLGF